jgi:SAM-dependent methyltransferase
MSALLSSLQAEEAEAPPSTSSAEARNADENSHQQVRIGENLAPFNPSMQPVVDTALELLKLSADDIFYELGCGDGRVMVAAAQATPGLRCVGVEYDEEYADRAKRAVDEAGLGERVSVLHANVLDVDISSATAVSVLLSSLSISSASPYSPLTTCVCPPHQVFVYLVPKGMKCVAPHLKTLVEEKGGRVVSYVFSVPGRLICRMFPKHINPASIHHCLFF